MKRPRKGNDSFHFGEDSNIYFSRQCIKKDDGTSSPIIAQDICQHKAIQQIKFINT